jgi:hypothetical protein
MVDANRDGKMSFIDGLTRDRDQTESNQPYRFWLNDDQDVSTRSRVWTDPDPETLPPLKPDDGDTVIQGTRDLEDFTRLWISFPSITDGLKSGKMMLGLKWKNVAAGTAPRLRLFTAVEADGDWRYIRDESIARRQVTESGKAIADTYGRTIVEPTDGTTDFAFARQNWTGVLANGNENAPVSHFLFEGVGEGAGDLVIVLLGEDGKAIAEVPGVRIELMNIKRMYARAHTTPMPRHFSMPYEQKSVPRFPYVKTASGGLTIPPKYIGFQNGNGAETPSDFRFEPPADEIPACIVFVHGIDMDIATYHSYAESGFKRFWWEGYRGRYCAFRWGTPLSPSALTRLNDGIDIFNDGEMRAWSYGPGLKMYVDRIRAEMRTSRVSIMAHSLGNAVVGSALRTGMTIDSYVAMEAAVSLSCYHPPARDGENDWLPDFGPLAAAENARQTPHDYTDLGYRGLLRDIALQIEGNLVSYHNLNDFWLATGKTRFGIDVDWVKNQRKFKPDDRSVTTEYQYLAEFPRGQRCYLRTTLLGTKRPADDLNEALAFVARSRTRALGAEPLSGVPAPGGGRSVDLNGDYKFDLARYDHSGQFQRNIQELYGSGNDVFATPLFRRLLNDLRMNEQ